VANLILDNLLVNILGDVGLRLESHLISTSLQRGDLCDAYRQTNRFNGFLPQAVKTAAIISV
jgi:hypothetical protein